MAYNKFFLSGKTLEIYEYERVYEYRGNGRIKGASKSASNSSYLDSTGGNSGQEQPSSKKRRNNAQRAAVAFKRLIKANLRGTELPLLVTLTFSENQQSRTESADVFNVFITRMRRHFGQLFRYVAVSEFQKRGAVHFHALFWGLPYSVYQTERQNRVISKIWGQGFVFLKQTDGHERLSTYLAKYMVKAMLDSRLFGKKAYFGSRNLFRPIVSSGFPAWWAEEHFDLKAKNFSLYKKYRTHYLGECVYRLYDDI